MNKTTFIIIFVFFVIIVGLILLKAFSKKSKCEKSDTPFQCIKKLGDANKKGIFIAANAGFPDMFDYPNSNAGSYRFYSANRADGASVLIKESNPIIKGNYDQENITWNNGTKVSIEEVFA